MITANALVNGLILAVIVILSGLAIEHWVALRRRNQMLRRLARSNGKDPKTQASAPGLTAIFWKLGAQLEGLFPSIFQSAIRKRLASAGIANEGATGAFMGLYLLLLVALSPIFISGMSGALSLWFVLPVVASVALLPWALVSLRRRVRDAKMAVGLPSALDLLTQMVEGGLDFSQAIHKFVQRATGPLSQELNRTYDDMLLGVGRAQAFTRLASRSTAPEVRRFAEAIIKVDHLGVSLLLVLRSQAEAIRLAKITEARVRAQRVSIKILLPVVLCFLPGVFIVTVAPAIFNIIEGL